MPWKKLFAAPVLGLLFVVFLPVAGFALTLGALAKRAQAAAARLESWAELG